MKKLYVGLLVSACLLGSYSTAESQILKRLEKKLEQKAERALDKALNDNREDTDVAAPQDAGVTTVEGNAATANTGGKSGTGPFKNIPATAYDFKAGSEVVFFDDFSNDSIGSMARHWTSNGRGTTASVAGFDGRWLRMYSENTYKIKDLVRIPENFTLEFDLLTLADSKDDISIEFGFDHQKGISRHYYLADQNPINIEASYQFDRFAFTSNELSQRKSSEVEANMSYFVNDVMKVELRIQGDRMEAFINEYKVLDTEMVDPNTKKYFYIAVNDGTNRAEIYMDNVRITQL